MTTPVLKDSFGVEVNVGDYVTFVAKTRYIHSQSIGRVIKISPKGQITIRAINTYGKTIEGYRADVIENRTRRRAEWAARGITEHLNPGHYMHESKDEEQAAVTPTLTRLHDATSCFKIPFLAVSPSIQQVLG